MTASVRPGWSRPSTILFATESPVNERALNLAAAQARESGAHLILFHAYDTLLAATSETSGICYYDDAEAARAEHQQLEPLARRLRRQGIECEIVTRPGMPADQILHLLAERNIDRIVMGSHAPGTLGKMLVGSVAEAVLRAACVPVCIVGPEVPAARYNSRPEETILCAVSLNETSPTVAEFAAELAAAHKARLILLYVIRPQERAEVLAGRTLDDVEAEMQSLVPEHMHATLSVGTIVTPGDPAEQVVRMAQMEPARMIVLGAQGASAFAAMTRHGIVYKVLAHAPCPVMTLSPAVLEGCGAKRGTRRAAEIFLAGVF